MQIRELTEEDYNSFIRITLLALETNPEAFTASAIGEDNEMIKIRFDAAAGPRKKHFILGLFDDKDELISILGAARGDIQLTAHKALIWVLYTTREHRGKGYATRLLEAAVERGHKIKDLEQLNVAVHSKNIDAVHMFNSCGFEEEGVERCAFKEGENYWNLIHMVNFLKRD